MGASLSHLLEEIRACTVCESEFEHSPRPVVQASATARIVFLGQAPGRRVHETGVPWQDQSGERLRSWLGLTDEQFYDPALVAHVPMGFCFPGAAKSGDKPPRPECAPLWHERLLERLPNDRLEIAIGMYAQKRYIDNRKQTLTETVKDSLQKFTLDGEFVESIRRLHTQLIAVNKDAAAAIVRTVKENQPDNDSPEYTSLVQHLGDLTALYDLGIGNLPSITDINTSIDDFYQRIETLARTPNVGETVYFQLANAIDYLETNRHHDQAIELGKVIADTAKSNPNEGLGKQGKKIGDDCAKRNSLIGSTWQFEESDVQGKNVSNEKFQGSVALIAFYADNAQTSPPFLRMMNSLERAFGGRNLQIVYVAVSDLEQGTTAQPALGHQNVLLKCSKSNPNQFLLQCPTDRFPYFILTDKESKVHSINVPTRELKTRIESLL